MTTSSPRLCYLAKMAVVHQGTIIAETVLAEIQKVLAGKVLVEMLGLLAEMVLANTLGVLAEIFGVLHGC